MGKTFKDRRKFYDDYPITDKQRKKNDKELRKQKRKKEVIEKQLEKGLTGL